MAGVEVGDFGSPDETRTPDKTTVEIVLGIGGDIVSSGRQRASSPRTGRAIRSARKETSDSEVFAGAEAVSGDDGLATRLERDVEGFLPD